MKRAITILAAAALMLTIMPLTAFAHGHGRRAFPVASYSLCDVDGCNTAGTHLHGGAYYYGHYVGDGHEYHQVCAVEGCTEAGNHLHDGVVCFPHTYGDGHSYHAFSRGGGCHY